MPASCISPRLPRRGQYLHLFLQVPWMVLWTQWKIGQSPQIWRCARIQERGAESIPSSYSCWRARFYLGESRLFSNTNPLGRGFPRCRHTRKVWAIWFQPVQIGPHLADGWKLQLENIGRQLQWMLSLLRGPSRCGKACRPVILLCRLETWTHPTFLPPKERQSGRWHQECQHVLFSKCLHDSFVSSLPF